MNAHRGWISSTRIWGGIFLASYGIFIEAGQLPPDVSSTLGWFYYVYLLGIAGTSISAGWNVARMIHSRSEIGSFIVFLIVVPLVGVTLYYLPWGLPSYYGNIERGWSVETNSAIQSIEKLLLIIIGTALVAGYSRKKRNSSAA